MSKMLVVKRVPLSDILPDPSNVRVHPARNINEIRASLRKFGQQKPIVIDMSNVVVTGNGLREAAILEGWTEIDAVQTDLDGPTRMAFAIADNRTGESSTWDYEALTMQLQALSELAEWDLATLGALGWAEHEIRPLLAAEWAPAAVDETAGTIAPAAPIGITITFTDAQWDAIVGYVRTIRDSFDLAEDRTENYAVYYMLKEYAKLTDLAVSPLVARTLHDERAERVRLQDEYTREDTSVDELRRSFKPVPNRSKDTDQNHDTDTDV